MPKSKSPWKRGTLSSRSKSPPKTPSVSKRSRARRLKKAAVNNALALLRQADKVFAFDAAAGCAFTSTEVEFENEGGSHFAFHAEYTGVCATPSKLRTLEIRGFEHFPSLEEFEAELLTAKGVHEMEIEKDEPRASIARAL